ncbi:substrate-binding periplasmic protein [Kiloniella sp.]|uniref:substrate-binding periplasmic protein n=1 Tax=Kiloniella sp. TaxID=1938587 RepID=UPI003B015013
MYKTFSILLCLLFSLSMTSSRANNGYELTLTTEEYPPFNFTDKTNNKITGIVTDIVREALHRSNIKYSLRLLSWQRAIFLARHKENTCVYSTTVTPERLPEFKWVGPLINNKWVFMGRRNSAITLNSIEDAKPYKIGGYLGDATALYLEKLGMNVDAADNDLQNPTKLKMGRIDLWATGHLLGPYYAREANVKNLEIIYIFKEIEMSLACNKSVPDQVISTLNYTLKKMTEDGFMLEIQAKYR